MGRDFTYEIKKTLASVKSDSDGWNLELNLISWSGRKPSYDLRKWSENHEKMGKGVAMSEDEVVLLFYKAKDILKEITGEDVEEVKEEVKRDFVDGDKVENEVENTAYNESVEEVIVTDSSSLDIPF